MVIQPTPAEIREILWRYRFLKSPVYHRGIQRANRVLAKLTRWAAQRNKEIIADLLTKKH